MDAITFDTLITGIKAATSLSKELLTLKLGGDVQAKVSEMNTKLISAQQHATTAYSSQMELSKLVHDLEEEVVRLKDWNVKKQDYELQALGKTAFAYVYKPPVDSTEPMHWLCSRCCDQDRKSVLQFRGTDVIDSQWDIWKCHLCESEIRVLFGSHP